MGQVFISISLNVLLIGIVYLFLRRRLRRVLDGSEFLDAVKDEVNHLVVDLNQTTERNIALIEERISRLKKLTDDADRKIVLMAKESEKASFGAEVYDRLKRAAAVTPAEKPRVVEPVVDTAPEAPPASLSEPERSAGDEVMELYRQGFDARLIATRTGTSIGEVELIISLANRNG